MELSRFRPLKVLQKSLQWDVYKKQNTKQIIHGKRRDQNPGVKTYKKASDQLVGRLDAQSARIAERLNLDGRMEKLAKKEAFITLKDHKATFSDHPTRRLINPTKSEIGVISKQILDEINTSIINSTRINQWKNTSSVLQWFNSLENKERLSFMFRRITGGPRRWIRLIRDISLLTIALRF